MSKLSIIVPIYNVEKYLLRCLDSIAAQTCRAFEAILIDDGSPDGCGRICDEYAAKDPRFTVIHQENRGVSAARNAGLRAAKGEYVGFVDPDDFIDPGMFAALLEAAAQTGAEIVCCNWETVHDDGRTCVHRLGRALPAQMPAEEFARHVFDVPRSIGGAVWNKLFRREILRDTAPGPTASRGWTPASRPSACPSAGGSSPWRSPWGPGPRRRRKRPTWIPAG